MTLEKKRILKMVSPIKSGDFPAIAMLVYWKGLRSRIEDSATMGFVRVSAKGLKSKPPTLDKEMVGKPYPRWQKMGYTPEI